MGLIDSWELAIVLTVNRKMHSPNEFCHVLVPRQMFNFPWIFFNLLQSMKQLKNSIQLPKPTRNTRKIANKLMTVVFDEIKKQ